MIFNRLFGTRDRQTVERSVYDAIVAQARQPWFYAELGVPDSVSGRFDMITLHAILVMERLGEGSEDDKAFAQELFDEMFRDMDRSLREMGVGDLSVGKRVRKMAEVFYGRAEAYRKALEADQPDDAEPLAEAIARNVFADAGERRGSAALAGYIRGVKEALDRQAPQTIASGEVHFPAAEQRS